MKRNDNVLLIDREMYWNVRSMYTSKVYMIPICMIISRVKSRFLLLPTPNIRTSIRYRRVLTIINAYNKI